MARAESVLSVATMCGDRHGSSPWQMASICVFWFEVHRMLSSSWEYDGSMCSCAAAGGSLAVLQWAREHDCQWDEGTEGEVDVITCSIAASTSESAWAAEDSSSGMMMTESMPRTFAAVRSRQEGH